MCLITLFFPWARLIAITSILKALGSFLRFIFLKTLEEADMDFNLCEVTAVSGLPNLFDFLVLTSTKTKVSPSLKIKSISPKAQEKFLSMKL